MGKPVIDWKQDSRSFEAVAELYDAYRPGYPPELIEKIVTTTGIRPGDRILEVGSGTGKATLPFARRGFSILCLEPGKNLVAVASRQLQEYLNVEYEITTFEDWPEHAGGFDLVMSAQAFHWVPKEVGYAKAAGVLRAGGHLALFWNRRPDLRDEIWDELDQVYGERVPEIAEPSQKLEEIIRQPKADLDASGCFGPVEVVCFPWSARYSTAEYLGLLNTYSDHLRLSAERREGLFQGVAEVIDRHGGWIVRPYVAVLYIARRK